MVDLSSILAEIHLVHKIQRTHIASALAESTTLAGAREVVEELFESINMELLNYPTQTKEELLERILSDLQSYKELSNE